MVVPSGDQRTLATCMAGFRRWRTAPDAASIAYNSATNQLSSPSPGAARYTRFLLSGDQSNSYTYMSAGEMDRTVPEATFMIARRCSTIFDAMTPDSGALA